MDVVSVPKYNWIAYFGLVSFSELVNEPGVLEAGFEEHGLHWYLFIDLLKRPWKILA